MASKSESFSELHRKNMEAAMRLAQMSIENSQRVVALQNDLARELFQDGIENARAQTGIQDPQEMLRLRAEYAQATTRKMMAAAQKMAELGNATRSDFSHMLTEQLAAGSQEMIDAFQGFFKTLPGGQGNQFMETMQQAMATATGAFEQITKASTGAFASMADTAQKGSGKPK